MRQPIASPTRATTTPPGRYPNLTKVLDADFDPDAPETSDERFRFGLGCVIEGTAAAIAAAWATAWQ